MIIVVLAALAIMVTARMFVPTVAEQSVLDEWKAAGLDPTPVGAHHE